MLGNGIQSLKNYAVQSMEDQKAKGKLNALGFNFLCSKKATIKMMEEYDFLKRYCGSIYSDNESFEVSTMQRFFLQKAGQEFLESINEYQNSPERPDSNISNLDIFAITVEKVLDQLRLNKYQEGEILLIFKKSFASVKKMLSLPGNKELDVEKLRLKVGDWFSVLNPQNTRISFDRHCFLTDELSKMMSSDIKNLNVHQVSGFFGLKDPSGRYKYLIDKYGSRFYFEKEQLHNRLSVLISYLAGRFNLSDENFPDLEKMLDSLLIEPTEFRVDFFQNILQNTPYTHMRQGITDTLFDAINLTDSICNLITIRFGKVVTDEQKYEYLNLTRIFFNLYLFVRPEHVKRELMFFGLYDQGKIFGDKADYSDMRTRLIDFIVLFAGKKTLVEGLLAISKSVHITDIIKGPDFIKKALRYLEIFDSTPMGMYVLTKLKIADFRNWVGVEENAKKFMSGIGNSRDRTRTVVLALDSAIADLGVETLSYIFKASTADLVTFLKYYRLLKASDSMANARIFKYIKSVANLNPEEMLKQYITFSKKTKGLTSPEKFAELQAKASDPKNSKQVQLTATQTLQQTFIKAVMPHFLRICKNRLSANFKKNFSTSHKLEIFFEDEQFVNAYHMYLRLVQENKAANSPDGKTNGRKFTSKFILNAKKILQSHINVEGDVRLSYIQNRVWLLSKIPWRKGREFLGKNTVEYDMEHFINGNTDLEKVGAFMQVFFQILERNKINSNDGTHSIENMQNIFSEIINSGKYEDFRKSDEFVNLKLQYDSIIKITTASEKNKTKRLKHIKIERVTSAISSLNMGTIVEGSCFHPEGINYWGPFTNALEVNKCDFHILDQNNNVVARFILAIDQSRKIVKFNIYYKNGTPALTYIVDIYIKDFAKKYNLELNGEINEVKALVNTQAEWYKDPVVLIR